MFSSSLIFLSLFALAACCRFTISGLSDDEKNQVVNSHNELRNFVASGQQVGQLPAENMKEMVWDDELGRSAQNWVQNWASRCALPNPQHLNSTGQNIHMESASYNLGINVSKYIHSWYDEVKEYNYMDPLVLDKTQHYLQIIWADTNKVGCAHALSHENRVHNLYFACHYSPPDNYLEPGEEGYIEGEPNCAKHSMQRSTNYPNLCV